MRKILSLLIATSLIAALASCKAPQPEPQNDAAREAVIDDLMGSVTAISDGEATPGFKGLALLRKDSLETEAGSWSSLEFNDGQFVLIEENSKIEISKLADDLKNTEITVTEGKIWVSLTNKLSDDESFEVKTPSCGMSVRGTVFSVSCDKEGSGRISVYEGTVSVEADEKSYEISEKALEITMENGAVKEVRTPRLDYDDAAPFYIKGEEGPGGVFEVLRDRLPGLTWDGDYPPAGGPTYDPIGIAPGTEEERPPAGAEGAGTGAPSPDQTPAPSPSPSEPATQDPSTAPSQDPTTSPSPSPTPTPTQSPTPTPTQSPTPTPTQSPAPTPTPSPTQAPPTPVPTPTPAAVAPKLSFLVSAYLIVQGSGDSIPFSCTGSEPITFDVQAKNSQGANYSNFGIERNTDTGNNSIYVPAWLPVDTYYLTVTAENSAGRSSVSFTVIIEAPTPTEIAPVISGGLNAYNYEVTSGEPASSHAISASGSAPITWSLQASSRGQMPGFVFINHDTGILTIFSEGAATGSYYFVIRAENSAGFDTREGAVSVNVGQAVETRYPPTFAQESHGYYFIVPIRQSGPSEFYINTTGSGPITYSLEAYQGEIPADVYINSSTGTLTVGLKTPPGTYYFNIRATNDVGTATQLCILTVD